MLPVIWSSEAQAELVSIMRYLSERNPVAATRLGHIIEQSTQRLPQYPYLFKTSERMPGCREIIAHPNYIVIYQVAADQIRVLRVLHSRREFPGKEDASHPV